MVAIHCLFNAVQVVADEEVKAAFDQVRDKFGRCDAVVNCAGIAMAFKLYSVSKKKMADPEKIKKTIDVCVRGFWDCSLQNSH